MVEQTLEGHHLHISLQDIMIKLLLMNTVRAKALKSGS